jgi:galacturan 1,4-alpha-galacturonidase
VAHVATAAQRDPRTPLVDKRASTCTPKTGGSSSTDDVPAIESAIASCLSGTIVIPSGTTYYINSAFTFAGCSGCTISLHSVYKIARRQTRRKGGWLYTCLLLTAGLSEAKAEAAQDQA